MATESKEKIISELSQVYTAPITIYGGIFLILISMIIGIQSWLVLLAFVVSFGMAIYVSTILEKKYKLLQDDELEKAHNKLLTNAHEEWIKLAKFVLAVIFFGLVIIKLAPVFLHKGEEFGRGIVAAALAPDVTVSCRESYVGNGYVLIVTNTGSKPLADVCVGSDEWQKRYVIAKYLSPGSSIEAGWVELPEEVKPNKTYYITADGYRGWKTVSL